MTCDAMWLTIFMAIGVFTALLHVAITRCTREQNVREAFEEFKKMYPQIEFFHTVPPSYHVVH